jgi:hypothetical protein
MKSEADSGRGHQGLIATLEKGVGHRRLDLNSFGSDNYRPLSHSSVGSKLALRSNQLLVTRIEADSEDDGHVLLVRTARI